MRFRPPASLTARLGWMFALAAALTFAGVGAYLYRSLALQLEAHDDRELIGKIGLVRHLLGETPSTQSLRADPHRFADAIAEHDGLMLLLRAADGTIVFESRPVREEWPGIPLVPADRIPDKASLHLWTLISGQPARTVAAWGWLADRREQVQIVVARVASDRMELLAAYRDDVLVAVLSGALLAALFGYMLTRRGLRPVRGIARQAQSITAQRLGTRLNVSAAPAELQALVASFNAMLDRLHESFQRLSQFSADLAHDMRTPVNNLLVQTQVALSQPRSIEEYHAMLASNVEEYERLSRMIESMLFLARADHAQIGLDRQPLDAGTELQRIADYFEGIAEEGGVRLIVRAGITVIADATLFRRAVNNLVANAIRYTPHGETVVLDAYPAHDVTVVAVANPGRSIDPEHVSRLFDRFYRVDPSRSNSAASAGLGLAIVQSIMALHGGRAEVDSSDNVTTFRLLFPAAPTRVPQEKREGRSATSVL